MEDLLALYGRLADLSGPEDLYAARVIEGRQSYRLGRDPSGNPALLISHEPPSDRPLVPPVELRNMSFRPRCVCRVREEGVGESEEVLAVLKCTTDDPLLREYFLRSVSGIIAGLPDSPDEADIAAAVDKLVELFRALEAPPRTSLQGLWGELFLIARAQRIRQAAAAWHADPGALHDFMAGNQRVEVKASTGPHRIHHFRLEQLLPQRGTVVLVTSFLLEESGRGLSINDLWDEVAGCPELTGDLRERLSKILALGLGRDWRRARRVAFDPDSAASELRLYDAATIPTVSLDLPAQVTEVRFKSELTDVESLPRSKAVRRGGLLEAMFA